MNKQKLAELRALLEEIRTTYNTYVGARYVPRFVGEYNITQRYDPLDVVDNGMGTSYIAKKPIPAGTPLTDTEYWFPYGSSSGAIVDLRQQINDMKDGNVPGSLQNQINDNTSDIQALTNHTIKRYNTVADMTTADLNVGEYAETMGYYSANDGGGALYEIKESSSDIHITLSNGNVAELIYDNTINVLQVGAKGDNITDDLLAFSTAISHAKEIVVPYGNGNRYILSNNITIGLHQYLHGDILRTSGDYPMLSFTSGGLVINNRECKVEALAITTQDSDIGIYIDTSGGHIPYITLKDIYIFNSLVGLKTEGSKAVWMAKIENVRCNYCKTGFELTYCHTCTFVGIYANRCTPTVAKMRNTKSEFITCNFGFIDSTLSAMDIDSGCEIDFIGCNFECDGQISTCMLEGGSNSLRFRNCKFTCNGRAGACCLAFKATCQTVVFDMCQYQSATGNDPTFEFILPSYARTAQYGGLVFGKGCSSLPRPSGATPTAYRPCVLDLDKNDVIHFIGTTIDKTKLSNGTVLFSDTQGKLCYYNGTNVVDSAGNIIV